jgi:MFS family permease
MLADFLSQVVQSSGAGGYREPVILAKIRIGFGFLARKFFMSNSKKEYQTEEIALEAPAFPSAGYAWYVVAVLYLSYTFSFVDRAIIGYLVGPIRADLQINDFQFSLIQGLAFTAFYATIGIPLGRFADSRSRRSLLIIGVALWSCMTMLCGMASNYWELFVARMGVGVGEACLAPCAYSLIADYFPREKRSLPLNIFAAGVMLGAGLANVSGGLVAQFALNGGPQDVIIFGLLKPWQLSFVLVGLPGIVFVLALSTIKEPARREVRGEANSREMFRYLRRHWTTYSSLIGGTTFGAMTNGAILGWIPAWFTRRYGWNNAQIGPCLGITNFLFGTVGLVLAGILAGKYIRSGKKAVPIKLMMLAEGLVIIPLILAHVVDEPYWALFCSGGVIFFGGFSAGLGPASLQLITPNEMRGQITAICFLLLNLIAGAIGPGAVGYLTTYYFADDKAVRSSAVIVGIVASLLGLISLRLGLRAYERTAEENRPAQI